MRVESEADTKHGGTSIEPGTGRLRQGQFLRHVLVQGVERDTDVMRFVLGGQQKVIDDGTQPEVRDDAMGLVGRNEDGFNATVAGAKQRELLALLGCEGLLPPFDLILVHTRECRDAS